MIDNHVWLEDPTAYENSKLWADSWQKLAAAISKARALFSAEQGQNRACQNKGPPSHAGPPTSTHATLPAIFFTPRMRDPMARGVVLCCRRTWPTPSI